jgi:nitroreductase
MDVYEAVTSRRAVRGFTDEPVSREVLQRVLSAAAWSPSGSNLQPWNSYVLTGALLAELKTRAVERVAHGDPWDEREYEMYPRVLKSPYGERRSAFGKERYSALGIAREDWEARQRAAIANWNCFGAPAALFCYIDRDLGRPQWADVGMYLQTVMLLLRAEGLYSLPADGVVASSRDGRGGPVTSGRADPLLRHVDRARGPQGELHPYGPRPARRDGHVRRRLVVCFPAGEDHSAGRSR